MTVVVGDVIAGRYELEEMVGTGGMSSVYRAHDRLLERSVALKILHDRYSADEEYVERFRREARAAARLSHPNIVTVIDRGEQDGRQFIVFEHVAGETLKDVVEREGPLQVRRVVELGIEIANALAFAHANGLVHRDVKPQNVLLNGDGRAKVTDFGIARSRDVEHGMTQTGAVVGTSHYIAPEQARGERVDEKSDIYSLGAVLYELLVGEVPYPGDNFVTVAMRHMNDPIPDIRDRRPEVPVPVAVVVDRALQKDPDDRFASMRDFARALESCLTELEGPGAQDPTLIVRRPAPPRDRRERPRRRSLRAPIFFLLGLAAIGAIVAGAVFLKGSFGGSSSGKSVPLTAVASYDPEGDSTEQDDLLGNATDGDPSSFWQTEHYSTPEFGNLKGGVGIMFDAGKPVELRSLSVTSDTPGFNARVKAASSESGPFERVSDSQTVTDNTKFSLDVSSPERYYVLWITLLPADGQAEINEVRGSS